MVDPAVVLLGSAATPWPEPGCRCRACLNAGAMNTRGEGAFGSPAALRVANLVITGKAVQAGRSAPVAVGIGDAHELSGIRVVGLPGAGGGTALVVALPGGGTALWAPEPGPLPRPTLAALAGAELEIVALGTGGDGEALARSLALLRRARALAEGCDVVAIGVDHATPVDRLAGLLRVWGARLAPDGAPLGRRPGLAPPRPPRRTLVLGPAASGKSALAEALLAAEPDVAYLPTGPTPTSEDAEWAARVDVHRRRRPAWWRTLEGARPAEVLTCPGPPLLLDSLGTWVTTALDRCRAWDDAPGWQRSFDAEVDAMLGSWRQAARQVVAVGEEAGWGVVPATAAGRRFRDCLGMVNRRLAAESERVLLVVAGRAMDLSEGVGHV